jgi:hypothetical protein
MEDLIKGLLANISTYGAGYLIAAIGFFLYWQERKAHQKERVSHQHTSDKLLELSNASIKADMDTTSALKTMIRVLDSVDRRLGRG